ncbi:uncharacterized protein J3R85_019802 [Psidium guajava]|nr:uncharacterized protein J3R85_019802 [Psidium guajava]
MELAVVRNRVVHRRTQVCSSLSRVMKPRITCKTSPQNGNRRLGEGSVEASRRSLAPALQRWTREEHFPRCFVFSKKAKELPFGLFLLSSEPPLYFSLFFSHLSYSGRVE